MKPLLSEESLQLVKKGNCIDFLRYFFILWIFVSHFWDLNDLQVTFTVPGLAGIRRVFFIISGFLIFYTYIRRPGLKDYISKRARRILPPYFAVIILCAAFGFIVSDLSFQQYFTSTSVYKYLIANLTFMNFLQPTLPGVFETNPIEAVNGALWTMKIEVLFYISVPIVFFLLKHFNKLWVIVGVLLFSVGYELLFTYLYEQSGNEIYALIRKQAGSQFVYFYSGALILLYFDKFMKHLKILFPISFAIFLLSNTNFFFNLIEPLAFSVVILGIAYSLKFLNFMRKYDNISYGVYLYHFPIIQLFIYYGIAEWNIYVAFIASLLVTLMVSALSWKLLEKPVIDKRWFIHRPVQTVNKQV